MRFWSKGTVLWLVLSVIFIYLVDLFTVSPNVTSGNGNLGLLIVVPAFVVFLLLARSLWRGLDRLELASNTRSIIGLGALVLLLVFCYLEYNFIINLVNDLGGSPEVEASKIYRYPWLNQYTNTIFINLYTFGILVTGVTLIKLIFKKKTVTNQK